MRGEIKGGSHLGVVRRWMQWHAFNGDQVTWGTHTLLRVDLHVDDLERIAQDVRDAVLEEFHVKDTDHEYRYRVFSDNGGPAFQFADTDAEIWKALFLARGHVLINEGDKLLFSGSAFDAREWCLLFRETQASEPQTAEAH
jgi:hypothetical protein